GYVPLLRGADLLVFGSQRQRQAWLQHYHLGEAKTCVVHNGVDTRSFQRQATPAGNGSSLAAAVPPQRIVLGSVGRLAPEKNQLALVRALAMLCADGVDAHLLLAGDGPMRAAIHAEAD